MKPNPISLVSALIIFAAGATFGVITSNTPSAAQIQAEAVPKEATPETAPPVLTPPPGPVGRFQISTYATNSLYGCYLLDTATGELWYSQQNSKMRSLKR